MLNGCERAFRLIFSLLLEKSLFVTDKTFFCSNAISTTCRWKENGHEYSFVKTWVKVRVRWLKRGTFSEVSKSKILKTSENCLYVTCMWQSFRLSILFSTWKLKLIELVCWIFCCSIDIDTRINMEVVRSWEVLSQHRKKEWKPDYFMALLRTSLIAFGIYLKVLVIRTCPLQIFAID